MLSRAQEHQRPNARGILALCALLILCAVVALPVTPASAGDRVSGFDVGTGDDSRDGDGGKDDKDDGKGDDKGRGETGDSEGFVDPKKVGKAKLKKNGDAVAPEGAPKEVVKAIKAANEINKMPYRYGGGHSGKKKEKGYDCSGAISHALRGGKMLKEPLDSGGFTKWGKKGKGEWITVYANGGHAYAVIAGLRFDTSSAGAAGGNQNGPRWWKEKASTKGFKARHPSGL
jgi:cell wall-associated NlpC family hydrolase